MKTAQFSEALGRIGDDYLMEAITYRQNPAPRRRLTRALLILAALLLLTCAACAVGYFGWNEDLRHYLGISDNADELSEAVVMIGQSQTADGITVTMEQAFGDTHTVYILATVHFSEGIPLDCRTNIRPVLKNVDGGYTFACIDVDEEARTQTLMINIRSSNKKLIGRKMGLEFLGFRGGRDYISYSSNTWSFSFRLNYRDLSKAVPLDITLKDYLVRSVWISPASIILYIEGLPRELRRIDDFGLIMKDGSSPDIVKYQLIGDVPAGDVTPIYGMFPQIIDPGEIRSITVDGIEIPLP